MRKKLSFTLGFLFFLTFFTFYFFLFALAATFKATLEYPADATVEPSSLNQLLNFTVNNTETASGINITQVNITLPSGFTFIEGYNGTAGNSTPTAFTFSLPNATWVNTTIIGFIQNG
ncbi:MAG: hypothetical protein QMD14_03185, partial [Candidatus Aenigmarchaeota archaeon]|nr:hypothetical protein [Candidatus Aenigmarchaeota archaeon]